MILGPAATVPPAVPAPPVEGAPPTDAFPPVPACAPAAPPLALPPPFAEPPVPLNSPQEHATLGAIAEHLARRWSLPIPSWTDDPTRFLRHPYFTSPLEALKPLLLVESPIAFRRRLIFTEAEPLRRARMPSTG